MKMMKEGKCGEGKCGEGKCRQGQDDDRKASAARSKDAMLRLVRRLPLKDWP